MQNLEITKCDQKPDLKSVIVIMISWSDSYFSNFSVFLLLKCSINHFSIKPDQHWDKSIKNISKWYGFWLFQNMINLGSCFWSHFLWSVKPPIIRYLIFKRASYSYVLVPPWYSKLHGLYLRCTSIYWDMKDLIKAVQCRSHGSSSAQKSSFDDR